MLSGTSKCRKCWQTTTSKCPSLMAVMSLVIERESEYQSNDAICSDLAQFKLAYKTKKTMSKLVRPYSRICHVWDM